MTQLFPLNVTIAFKFLINAVPEVYSANNQLSDYWLDKRTLLMELEDRKIGYNSIINLIVNGPNSLLRRFNEFK